MIKERVEINLKDKYYILLIFVCLKGYLNIVEELIWVGVDVNLEIRYYILLIFVCCLGYFSNF